MHSLIGKKPVGSKKLTSVIAIAGLSLVVIFLATRQLILSESLPEESLLKTTAGPTDSETPTSLNATESDSFHGNKTTASEDPPQAGSRLVWKDGRASNGQFDTPGFSEDEVRLLQERQAQEVKRMLSAGDAIVIESGTGDGMTVAELQSLHAQQSRSAASASNAEVVIPAAADGTVARTVADLTELHEKQRERIVSSSRADEIVIPVSSVGMAGLTQSEIAALQERQRIISQTDDGPEFKLPAPVPKAGSDYSTVDEMRERQKGQQFN